MKELLESVKDVSVQSIHHLLSALVELKKNRNSERDYFVQVLFIFMSRTTVFYEMKPKTHITYIAYEAIASQRSQHSTSQETYLLKGVKCTFR